MPIGRESGTSEKRATRLHVHSVSSAVDLLKHFNLEDYFSTLLRDEKDFYEGGTLGAETDSPFNIRRSTKSSQSELVGFTNERITISYQTRHGGGFAP